MFCFFLFFFISYCEIALKVMLVLICFFDAIHSFDTFTEPHKE